MNNDGRWDDMFELLSDPYRRELLVALLDHNPQDDDDLNPLDRHGSRDENEDRLEITLRHRHLPKLEDMDVIEWDREANEIKKGPNWDDIAPLLRLIQDHQDELPPGWL